LVSYWKKPVPAKSSGQECTVTAIDEFESRFAETAEDVAGIPPAREEIGTIAMSATIAMADTRHRTTERGA
jgi:hypothetical protein